MKRADVFLHQLARYQPADELERRHHRELVDLVRTAADPFSRNAFEPGHITASVFIIDGDGRLLLHHHRRLGRWLQMGGHIEHAEMPVEAALREGREESGLHDLLIAAEGLIDVDIHPIPAGRGEPDHRHFDVRYVARTAMPEAIARDAAESVDLRWFNLDDAAAIMDEPESRRVIRKIAGMLCAS